MGATPPPPPPRPLGMQGGVNPYQPQPSYGQNLPPQMQNPYGQQPPLMNQQMNQHYGPPPGSQYGSQQMPPQRGAVLGGQQPTNQQYGQPQNLVSSQNIYGHPQHGSAVGVGVHQMPGSSSNSYGMPSNQQAPPFMNPLQQLPQQQSYANSPYSPPSAAQNRFSEPGGPPNRWANQGQNPPQSPAAVDILALADKASSAVQALQNQNKFQINPSIGYPPMSQPQNSLNPYQTSAPPQPYGQPQMSAPPPSYQPMNQPYQQPPQPQPDQALAGSKMRRRTTATLNELPITVQYAVQVCLQNRGRKNGSQMIHSPSQPCALLFRICKLQVK